MYNVFDKLGLGPLWLCYINNIAILPIGAYIISLWLFILIARMLFHSELLIELHHILLIYFSTWVKFMYHIFIQHADKVWLQFIDNISQTIVQPNDVSTETAKENMQHDDTEIPSATTDVTPPTTKTATGTADAINIIQKQSGLTKQNILEFGLRVVSCSL